MTKLEIKHWMIERINETLEEYLNEDTILENIDKDTLNNFMYYKDYGKSITEDYIEENMEYIVDNYLEAIYDEIDATDLDVPF